MKQTEKDWLKRVARYADEHGCFPHGNHANYQLHHVVGRKGRNNKVDIGNWFVLPVQVEYHDPNSNHHLNVTHFRRRYTDNFGMQWEQWAEMIQNIMMEDDALPFGEDVIEAIMTARH